jgi:TonB family protein
LRRLLLPIAFLALLASAARAAEPVVVEASWKTKPTGEAVSRLYPEAAQRAGVSGKVKVRCTVAVDGELTNCVAIEEDPPGMGFGPAALQLLTTARFNPKTIDGKPVESEKVIPLGFAASEGRSIEPAPVPDAAVAMACLGQALDDQAANPSLRARGLASLWYSLANFTAMLNGRGVVDFLNDVEASQSRATRLRDDPAQGRLRQQCETAIVVLQSAAVKRRAQ